MIPAPLSEPRLPQLSVADWSVLGRRREHVTASTVRETVCVCVAEADALIARVEEQVIQKADATGMLKTFTAR